MNFYAGFAFLYMSREEADRLAARVPTLSAERCAQLLTELVRQTNWLSPGGALTALYAACLASLQVEHTINRIHLNVKEEAHAVERQTDSRSLRHPEHDRTLRATFGTKLQRD